MHLLILQTSGWRHGPGGFGFFRQGCWAVVVQSLSGQELGIFGLSCPSVPGSPSLPAVGQDQTKGEWTERDFILVYHKLRLGNALPINKCTVTGFEILNHHLIIGTEKLAVRS
jgi:hypothetical protein